MNVAHVVAGIVPPYTRSSPATSSSGRRESAYPIHTEVERSGVKPTNQASRHCWP